MTSTSVTAQEFLDLFFDELDRRQVPYVIIHSYEDLPEDIEGDIDYAVSCEDLPKLTDIQEELGRAHGWAVIQSLQHGVFAYYNVLVSLSDPRQILMLDACSNYARARRLLVSHGRLLGDRRRFGKYWIPAPAAELNYEITKLFDAKQKDPAKYMDRLRTLWMADKSGSEAAFRRAFGETDRSLEEWFEAPASEWQHLRSAMLARNRFGPWLLIREAARVIRRVIRPSGLQVTLLGSDGSGKSTLINSLTEAVAPMFRRIHVCHFRPKCFEKSSGGGAVTEPHGEPAYGLPRSLAKIGYYFMDHWVGRVFDLQRRRISSTLVIFDRDFNDLLVDPKRYRLCAGSVWLVRVLRRLVPKSDLTYVLDLDPETCFARKPELSVDELEGQRTALQAIAATESRSVLVDVDRPVKEITDTLASALVTKLRGRRGHAADL